ncbi:MAG: lipocalin-like domain-containing protein [Pseudomonadota bacterium]
MNVSRRHTLALLAAWPSFVQAQGFAGLGSDAEGFALPQRGKKFRFPADHGPHPEFRIEWWYVTAVLKGDDGQDYGIQWTLFRSALTPETDAQPGWQSPQIWFAHAGLTTPNTHYVAETLARGGVGQAGVNLDPFDAWIDDWYMQSSAAPDEDALSQLTLAAKGDDFRYQISLTAEGPLVLQGIDGFSPKAGDGRASHYYAQPFYRAEGTLSLPGGDISVEGRAWLDREWSSQPLAEGQSGWDWFALHLDTGEKVMAAQLRDGGPGYAQGNWISPEGANRYLDDGTLTLTPLGWTDNEGRDVPTKWRVEIPSEGLDITTTPVNPKAWMGTGLAYWEGPIRFTGSHTGRGYLEMTGYE